MFLGSVLAQTGLDFLPAGSPWWAAIALIIMGAIGYAIRQSVNNKTLQLENDFKLALEKVQGASEKERGAFQLQMEAMRQEQAQDTANASAIQTLATTLSTAITGLQDTVRTFAEERRESTQAIRENTEVYRRANAVAEKQNKQIDELLQQMRPLTSAIPDAVNSIVSTFTRTEQTIVAAIEQNLDIGIVIVNQDQRITASNPQAASLFKTDKLPAKIPNFVRMYTFPARDMIERDNWICNRVLKDKRAITTIAGITAANREIVWLWIIAEPYGDDAVRLAMLDATNAARALKHIDEETKRITDEVLTPST